MMKIENNKMVSLIYELRESDKSGRVIESLQEDRPLQFIFGTGRLLPVFESYINELRAGDNFSFSLSSGDAYGDRREEMIVNVPVNVFQAEDGKLNEEICRIGNQVPMMDGDGNHLNGIVNEITDEYIRMDFNHPMAGVDLFFTGKIIDVRDATEQEIAGTAHSCSSCGSDPSSGCSGHCG
ncbi:MAG TPA: FKBP-type peptidyl-prolyl cis-trans isomerase [Bacteroidales bacterium]|nr:FKBP-type peptidyl-prolyl cis-trans isomerase [Bacteroidales bacterium]